jgi:hypothetical protein
VLMGVEVSRVPSGERPEAVDLAAEIGFGSLSDCRRRACRSPAWDATDPPTSDLGVQTDAEPRSPSRLRDGLDRARPLDHEAAIRHDAFIVCAQDSTVDATAVAEVVGVDEQISHFQVEAVGS